MWPHDYLDPRSVQAKRTNASATPRAQSASKLKRMELLLICPIEEVVGRVGHELSLTRGADAGRDSSAVGVQTLNEAGVEQEVTARGPFLVPHRLQQ